MSRDLDVGEALGEGRDGEGTGGDMRSWESRNFPGISVLATEDACGNLSQNHRGPTVLERCK